VSLLQDPLEAPSTLERNIFRRPHRYYRLLTSLEVEEPFVRVDASGEAYDRSKR
jgi:hypothetical protein